MPALLQADTLPETINHKTFSSAPAHNESYSTSASGNDLGCGRVLAEWCWWSTSSRSDLHTLVQCNSPGRSSGHDNKSGVTVGDITAALAVGATGLRGALLVISQVHRRRKSPHLNKAVRGQRHTKVSLTLLANSAPSALFESILPRHCYKQWPY